MVCWSFPLLVLFITSHSNGHCSVEAALWETVTIWFVGPFFFEALQSWPTTIPQMSDALVGWVKTSIYRLRWLGPHSTNQYEAHFIRVPNRQSAFFFICEVVAFPRTCHDHLCCTPGRVQHATLQWSAGSCGTISGGSNRTQEHRGPKRGAPWWFRFMLNKMWLES